jgi:basic secretory peptidase family protein
MKHRPSLEHLRSALARQASTVASLVGLPEREFTMRWMTDGTGAAHAHGDTATICLGHGWFTAHPDDYGCLSHEYTHVLQNVPGGTCPPEVVEGFADAVRYLLGQYDSSWWHPSEMASRIAALTQADRIDLSRLMHDGGYSSFVWPAHGATGAGTT